MFNCECKEAVRNDGSPYLQACKFHADWMENQVERAIMTLPFITVWVWKSPGYWSVREPSDEVAKLYNEQRKRLGM